MAQKAAKSLAKSNTATLNRTHLISLGLYALFLLLRAFLITRRIVPFILLVLPALSIEFWFERIGRPSSGPGEDLAAKGLTEWMWDVVYWTWGNVALVALVGDWAWWLYAVVPLYSAWLAFSTYSGVKQGFGAMGAGAGGEDAAAGSGGQSKRQAKMEKRGGQQVRYR